MAKVRSLVVLTSLLCLVACEPSDDFSFNSEEGGDTTIGNSAISFDPVSLDFGNVAPSPSFKDEVVTVTNSSEETLNMGAASGLSTSFAVSTNECEGRSLAAGASCQITVRFSPQSGGGHLAELSVLYGSETSSSEAFFASMNMTGTSNADDPSNYQLTFVTGTTMTFTWSDNASNETGYEIQRCNGSACDTAFSADETTFVAADTTSHTITGLTEGEFYKVRLRALSDSGNSEFLEGDLTLTFDGIQTVDNGDGLSAFLSQIDCNSNDGVYVGLQWNPIANAASYSVFEVDAGVSNFIASVPAGSDSYMVTDLEGGLSKTYRVSAVSSIGVVTRNITNDTSLTTSNFNPCFVIGQVDATSMNLANAGYNPYEVWTDGTRLIMAETSNHRVLIWNTMPTTNGEPADIVIGQPDMNQNIANNGGRSASSLNNPRGVFYDGTRLYIADLSNHRVLIYNSLPTANGAAADVVIGQTTFSAASAGVSSTRLNSPHDVQVAGGKIFIADYANNRVVILNSIPTSNFPTFDVVVGQSNMTNKATTCNQTTLRTPRGLWTDGTQLIVPSYDRHRVMVWNTIPTVTGTGADVVIGQNNFTSCGSNGGTGRNDFGFNRPWDVTSDGTSLWVSDYSNHRVLYFATIPSTAGVSADGFYGPSAFTANTTGTDSQRVRNPTGLAYQGGALWIADAGNHRLLKRDPAPIAAGGELHTLVLQKENFLTGTINRQSPNDGSTVDTPGQVASDGTALAVADTNNHRVLIWNTMPTKNKEKADVVLGQPDEFGFARENAASDRMFDSPHGVAIHGGKLYVADSNNHRILVWNSIPTAANTGADFVLGQTNFNSFGNGTGASQLRYPTHIAFSDAGHMIVADRDNNRVLIWNTPPTVNAQAADVVVGQSGFGANTAAVTQSGIDGPWSAIAVGTSLVIAERDNYRVMIWNTIPTANGASADVVLGQPDFTSRVQDNGGTTDSSLDQPIGLATSGGKLYVSDYDNNRIMIWNSLPTTNNESANSVYGQPNFASVTQNNGGRAFDRLSLNRFIFAGSQHLFIPEYLNQRVLAVPLP